MNKKGFTLVELLAVIAILGIIVLVGIPNVVKLFKKGNEDTMIIQENQVMDAAKLYVEDYCRNPIDGDYAVCNSERQDVGSNSEVYFCLNSITSKNYLDDDVMFNASTPCDGIIVFKRDGKKYSDGKTYLFCGNKAYVTKGYNKYTSAFNNCGIDTSVGSSEPTNPSNPTSDCSFVASGNSRTYNNTMWYTGPITLTLNTSSSNFEIKDKNGNHLNDLGSNTITINNDITNETVTGTVYKDDGTTENCSITLNKDTTSPKIYFNVYSVNNPSVSKCQDILLTDSLMTCLPDGTWYNSVESESNNDLTVASSYKVGDYGWFVAAIDNVDFSESANVASSSSGHGFGVGLKSLEWDYNGGSNFSSLSGYNYNSYIVRNTYNNSSSNKIIAYKEFTTTGSRTLNYKACDYLDNCVTHTLNVTLTN